MNRAERRAQLRGQNRARLSGVARESHNKSISLHINELVLHGFPMETRHAVGDATQLELTRLLSARGLPEFVTSRQQEAAIDGGSFNVTPQAKPNVVGSLIAKAVYGGRRR
jgi:hypothetical protein